MIEALQGCIMGIALIFALLDSVCLWIIRLIRKTKEEIWRY